VVNLLCEHCLVGAFVDQQKTVSAAAVESVAREFDLGDNTTSQLLTTPRVQNAQNFDLLEALKTLATIADRLRESGHEVSKEEKL
jgi:hypothetical protein